MNKKDRELQICRGVGNVYWEELIDYHKREYTTHSDTCYLCKGSGRIIKIVETITTIEPYAPENWGKKWW